MDSHRQRIKALELLAQLVPGAVIERARKLAQRIEREDYVKDYMASKGLIVAVTGISVSFACFLLTLVLLKFLFRSLAPLTPGLKLTLVLFGFAACLGAILALMYLLLSYLQRAALAKRTRHDKPAQSEGADAEHGQ